MQAMNVLEYERRVKKFVTQENKGFISVHQLRESFNGTGLFEHLNDPESLRTKFLLSTFVADFPVGSTLDLPNTKNRGSCVVQNKRHRSRTDGEINFLSSVGIRETSTELFFSALTR